MQITLTTQNVLAQNTQANFKITKLVSYDKLLKNVKTFEEYHNVKKSDNTKLFTLKAKTGALSKNNHLDVALYTFYFNEYVKLDYSEMKLYDLISANNKKLSHNAKMLYIATQNEIKTKFNNLQSWV